MPIKNPEIFNHPEEERLIKIIPKITYLNIMTKTANAIDFLEKIIFQKNVRIAKLMITVNPPKNTLMAKLEPK